MTMQTRNAALEVRSVDEETRSFTAVGVPYGQIYDLGYYRERFEPGSVDASGAVLVYQHAYPIGTITATRETDAGLEIDAHISETSRGDEVYTLIRDGVLRSMSIGFELEESREDTVDGIPVTTVTKARAIEFSVVLNPAYSDAKINEVRSTDDKENRMSEIADLQAQITDLERRLSTAPVAPPAPAKPDVRSVGEYLQALASGDMAARDSLAPYCTRAYQGGTTADDALTQQPAFLKDLTEIIEQADPISPLFSRGPLPAQGMTLEFLEVADNTVTVKRQEHEGDALPVGKVTTKVRTAPINTWGGANTMSFQEIHRSRSNMVSTTVRAMAVAAGRAAAADFHTNFEAAVQAQAANAIGINKAVTAVKYADLIGMLLDANAAYQDLGYRCDGLIVDRATWQALMSLETSQGVPLMALSGHGQGVVGTIASDVLAGTLGNLRVIPDLKATSARGDKVAGAFFNSEAIRVYTSGVAHLQDDNVLTLTRDMSVYYYTAIAAERPQLVVPLKIGA
jgi:caudovirus prohead protease|nr:MAG TPA: head maturation protease [Caudoviricetes sp.]